MYVDNKIRVPVKYKNLVLMPTRLRKAKILVREGKAIFEYDNKLKLRYLQLKVSPSDTKLQELRLGFDIGSYFDGISIVGSKSHNINVEIIHDRSIKERMIRRARYRRMRRTRLRHRIVRLISRTKSKIVPTVFAIYQNRINVINKLTKYFPISKIIIEIVKYSGKYQQGWTQVHVGQSKFIEFLRSKFNSVLLTRGYITKSKRVKLFGTDLKINNKGKRSFFAHCLDSFAIASLGFSNKLIKYLNKCVRFRSSLGLERYHLTKLKSRRGDDKYYFRYLKNGVKEYFSKFSKYKKVRFKPTGEYSNHPKVWDYMFTKVVECFKKKKYNYGGTTVTSNRWIWNLKAGDSKYSIDSKRSGYYRKSITIVTDQ
jgi:hypothetical protein